MHVIKSQIHLVRQSLWSCGSLSYNRPGSGSGSGSGSGFGSGSGRGSKRPLLWLQPARGEAAADLLQLPVRLPVRFASPLNFQGGASDPQTWRGKKFEKSGSYRYSILPIRVSDPDPYWIRIQSGQWIRIRIRNLDPYQMNTDPYQMNTDPKHCFLSHLLGLNLKEIVYKITKPKITVF